MVDVRYATQEDFDRLKALLARARHHLVSMCDVTDFMSDDIAELLRDINVVVPVEPDEPYPGDGRFKR